MSASSGACPEPVPVPLLPWGQWVYQRVLARFPYDALNCDSSFSDAAIPGDLSELLLDAARVVFERATSADDSLDYAGLAQDSAYTRYRSLAAQLVTFDLNGLRDDAARKAFWVNLYNALIVQAVITYQPITSLNEVPQAFDRAGYVIGGWRYSANDIEHGILRLNAGHPAVPGPQFADSDPRRKFALVRPDARVHFALNCAARSCPPIRFYRAEQIEQQLDWAAQSFIQQDGAVIRRDENTVYLSKLFRWYASDFGAGWLALWKRTALIDFVARYLTVNDRDWLLERRRSVRILFSYYDWSLNV